MGVAVHSIIIPALSDYDAHWFMGGTIEFIKPGCQDCPVVWCVVVPLSESALALPIGMPRSALALPIGMPRSALALPIGMPRSALALPIGMPQIHHKYIIHDIRSRISGVSKHFRPKFVLAYFMAIPLKHFKFATLRYLFYNQAIIIISS